MTLKTDFNKATEIDVPPDFSGWSKSIINTLSKTLESKMPGNWSAYISHPEDSSPVATASFSFGRRSQDTVCYQIRQRLSPNKEDFNVFRVVAFVPEFYEHKNGRGTVETLLFSSSDISACVKFLREHGPFYGPTTGPSPK